MSDYQYLCFDCETLVELEVPENTDPKKVRVGKCPVCGGELHCIPKYNLWDVKYHLECLKKALEPKEEKEVE